MAVFAWGPKDSQKIVKYHLDVEAVLRPFVFI
jgi:hypothetical protein